MRNRVVAAKRVYFDTQQLNYLSGPDKGPHPADALRRIRKAITEEHVEIVGSLDLLQELIEAVPSAPRKSRRMIDLFFKLVGERVLLPLSERVPAEVMTGGLLSEEARYLSRELRRDARRLAQSMQEGSELAEELFREKVAFLADERTAQHRMRERLAEGGVGKQARLMRAWIANVDIQEWVRDIIDGGRARGRVPEQTPVSPDRVPSAVAFVAVRLVT